MKRNVLIAAILTRLEDGPGSTPFEGGVTVRLDDNDQAVVSKSGKEFACTPVQRKHPNQREFWAKDLARSVSLAQKSE